MNFGDKNPTFEELMEVVQRQQEVIEIYEQQVEATRVEFLKIAEESEKKDSLIRVLEETETLMKSEIQQLQNEKEDILKARNNKLELEEAKANVELEAVSDLQLKCKELTRDLEKMKTENSTLEIELNTEKRNHEFVRAELEKEQQKSQNERLRMTANVENMEKELREKWKKQQETLIKNQVETARMKTEIEIKQQREKHLERYYEDVTTEMEETRKEKAAAMVKCSTLTAEIAELKSKMHLLRARLPKNEHDIEDMSKLLGDQSHLISVLREEAKLLARKLENDSREYRQTIKLLKHEKRELEQRIENFLRVD